MKKKFTIGYFADGPWSHKAFDLIIKNPNIEILFIVPRYDTIDNTLKEKAKIHKIDYLSKIKINTSSFYEKAKDYNCDLFVSMSFDQIFKKKIINLPRFKTINCHAGKLPYYRGRNVLNWVLINGEKEFGITVHYIDEGIDTGDIILQKTYPISNKDNYKSLLKLAYDECAEILYNAINLIIKNKHKVIKQSDIDPIGSYCKKRSIGDEIINWNQTSRQLYNFIRAICSPGPSAITYFNHKEIKINESNLIESSHINNKCKVPGSIISKTKYGYIVKTVDSYLEIKDILTKYPIKVGGIFENE
tara:strand:- start:7647 stop:8555 length:909 start_codon:yes stop_codon:yes gene_type:complete